MTNSGLQLPKFQRNPKQTKWIASEKRTATFIKLLWRAASEDRRRDARFLQLMVQLGWSNRGQGNSTKRWRNLRIAKYLKVSYRSDEQLARDLHSTFKSIPVSKCLALLSERTGITLYYTAYRPATLALVKKRSAEIALAFKKVATNTADVSDKVRRVASSIESLGALRISNKVVSPFKGLTPVLSCLDPQSRFPIMNKRTHGLLQCIGEKANKNGIVALSKLIGPTYDIADARELDVYASSVKFPNPIIQRAAKGVAIDGFKDIGLKSEINSLAQIAAKKTIIKKLHNELINRLNDYLLWRHVMAKESRFDALVLGWKKGRDLLIEAKTTSVGVTGQSQIRQAIGQLYDYRFTFMPTNKVDLAILLPKEPSSHIKQLLDSLGIELLWFKGKKLTGTIRL